MKRSSARQKNSKPKPVPVEIRASHTAAFKIDKRMFRLSFWTDDEWRALSAGEFVSNAFYPLSGFGRIRIDELGTTAEYSNALCASINMAGPYPELPTILAMGDSVLGRGLAPVLEILQAAKAIGFGLALKTLKRAKEELDHEAAEVAVAQEIRHEAYERIHPEPAYAVVEQDCLCWHAPRRFGLDRTIATELEEMGDTIDDRAIWKGRKLMATIHAGPDGKPVVTRFDGTEKPRRKKK